MRSPFSKTWLLIEVDNGRIVDARPYAWPSVPHAADHLDQVLRDRTTSPRGPQREWAACAARV
jgi:hypothetical protein